MVLIIALLSLVVMLMPILPLIFMAKWSTALMDIEGNDVVIPNDISFMFTFKNTKSILKKALNDAGYKDDALISRICTVIIGVKRWTIIYILTGALQFAFLVNYIYLLASNFMALKPELSGMCIAACITIFVSFWAFYGSNLFQYLKLYNAKKLIDTAVKKFFIIVKKLEEKATVLILSFIYFFLMIFYLYFLAPVINSYSNEFYALLLWHLFLIFIYYEFAPPSLAKLYSCLFNKSKTKLDKWYVSESIRNTTYLSLLVLFIIATSFQQSSGALLQAIAILFLYDTYKAKRQALKEKYNLPSGNDSVAGGVASSIEPYWNNSDAISYESLIGYVDNATSASKTDETQEDKLNKAAPKND